MTRALQVAICIVIAATTVFAGGPMYVGGRGYGVPGKPITWPQGKAIHYRVDSGAMATNGTTTIIGNADGLMRVASMFQVWADAPHTSLSFQYDGAITGVNNGHVGSASALLGVLDSCSAGSQNPIVFDPNGQLVAALGLDPAVIGFAGVCDVDPATGSFKGAFAVMNGAFQDRLLSNGELSANGFDEAITHELGHFLGLDHSQINVDVLDNEGDTCDLDTLAGLPLMFPYSLCQERKGAGLPVLAPDDIAWISSLYPAGGTVAYGKITGQIFFSDGMSQFQGANVIARRVNDPMTTEQESRRIAVSAVSGYLFTTQPGQAVTATYLPCKPGATDCTGYRGNNSAGDPFGSMDAAKIGYYELSLPPGDYTVEVEPISWYFVGGSSVGPFKDFQFRIPVSEFWNSDESYFDIPTKKTVIHLDAGQAVNDIDIILNETAPRFDLFEGPAAMLEMHSAPKVSMKAEEVRA